MHLQKFYLIFCSSSLQCFHGSIYITCISLYLPSLVSSINVLISLCFLNSKSSYFCHILAEWLISSFSTFFLCLFFLLLLLFNLFVLLGRVTERKRDKERDLPLLVCHNSQSWTSLKRGASSDLSCGCRVPRTCTILWYSSRPLADSWIGSGAACRVSILGGRGLAC